MKLKQFLIISLLISSCASLVSAATVLTQYQWNPSGDWFSDPIVTPTGTSSVSLLSFSNAQQNGSIFNYVSNTLIANGINNDSSTQITGVSGPGLSFIVQNAGQTLSPTTNGSQFRLRPNVGRFNVETGSGSTGMTTLAWSAASATPLDGLSFTLGVGPAGANTAGYQEGLRIAIQDTASNWYLSRWTSNDALPDAGTTPGNFSVDLSTETWAPYTPAGLGSGSLVTFDADTATFSTVGGDVHSFGFYFQQNSVTGYRINGFQVTAIPEPGSAALVSLFALCLAARRRR